MKTPEEIKKALSCSITQECLMGECPYHDAWYNDASGGCFVQRGRDALAYIKQLEEQIANYGKMATMKDVAESLKRMGIDCCYGEEEHGI